MGSHLRAGQSSYMLCMAISELEWFKAAREVCLWGMGRLCRSQMLSSQVVVFVLRRHVAVNVAFCPMNWSTAFIQRGCLKKD